MEDSTKAYHILCERSSGGDGPREATLSFPGLVLRAGMLPCENTREYVQRIVCAYICSDDALDSIAIKVGLRQAHNGSFWLIWAILYP